MEDYCKIIQDVLDLRIGCSNIWCVRYIVHQDKCPSIIALSVLIELSGRN
jgi:hypothetical protein